MKGNAEPVEVWQAVAPLARFGTDVTRRHDSPLIGRHGDLALLVGAFDATTASSSPRLVTIVGEPGMGKSRLVAELFGHTDSQTDLVTWRQGRCLPYGDGITFWALGEILKAHAGILETDPTCTDTRIQEPWAAPGPHLGRTWAAEGRQLMRSAAPTPRALS